ncbi:hypothetical protein VMCG_07520 [Cytospora schulzeri]|uniref:Uncharacterized protein n=1 Tax=Cytospora schulzeri TaxID=448051 RepID=A0A423W1A3_9PEZI|nr:hypothetical protein VMCG_07520 [Valsa malicola]
MSVVIAPYSVYMLLPYDSSADSKTIVEFTYGLNAIVILELNGRVPQSHGARLLLEDTGNGVRHGLLPGVCRLVDERVVEDDAVLIVDVGRPLVSHKLHRGTGVVLAVHLRGDAPRGVGVGAGTLALARRVGANDALDQITSVGADADPGEHEPLLVLGHLAGVDGARGADDLGCGRIEASDGAP